MHKQASTQNAYAPCASVCGAPEIPPSNVWPGSKINVCNAILTLKHTTHTVKDIPVGHLKRTRAHMLLPSHREVES